MPDHSPLADVIPARLEEHSGWLIPADYGDPAAEYQHAVGHVALFDRSHVGKVELTGDDAPSFLHNLCTNDILTLPLGGGCEAFLTTAKAKAVAYLLVYHLQLHDGRRALWLDVTPGMAEAVVKHLDHYLISERVELADRTREFAQMHLAGPQAAAVLGRVLGEEIPPLEPLQHMMRTFGPSTTCHVRRNDPLGVPGFDIACLKSRAAEVWGLLTSEAGRSNQEGRRARPAGNTAYEQLRVEAGTPVYGPDIDQNRFVVEIGRTAQAISYAKGCYLGQEPIVMARDRAGHVNRTLLGLRLTADATVPSGSTVKRDGEDVGVTGSSVRSPRTGTGIALAYIRRGHQTPGTPVEVITDGGPVRGTVVSLPFTSASPNP